MYTKGDNTDIKNNYELGKYFYEGANLIQYDDFWGVCM